MIQLSFMEKDGKNIIEINGLFQTVSEISGNTIHGNIDISPELYTYLGDNNIVLAITGFEFKKNVQRDPYELEA